MTDLNKKANNGPVINVVNGAGNEAIPYEYTDGDTVDSILKKAGITLDRGVTVTLGRKNVKDPDHTPVKPNDTLVIANKVSNG